MSLIHPAGEECSETQQVTMVERCSICKVPLAGNDAVLWTYVLLAGFVQNRHGIFSFFGGGCFSPTDGGALAWGPGRGIVAVALALTCVAGLALAAVAGCCT